MFPLVFVRVYSIFMADYSDTMFLQTGLSSHLDYWLAGPVGLNVNRMLRFITTRDTEELRCLRQRKN